MFRKTFLCLFLVPLLCGCGDGNGMPANLPQTSVSRQASDFELIASTTKQRFSRGELIPITLQVTNKSAAARNVVFSASSTGAYVVTQGSTEIIRGQRAGGGATTPRTLQPFEQYSIELQWNQNDPQGNPVPAVRYTMRAYMPVILVDGVQYTYAYAAQADLYTESLDVVIEN